MSEATVYICEARREIVNPKDPSVVRAVEMIDVGSFGSPNEQVEGLGVFFHEQHFPRGSRRYRRKPE